VYQRTDSFEDFPAVNRELIKQYDRKLKANADLTVYVNSTLYQSESSQCRKALYVDHGVDFESFASADTSQVVPSDMAEIPRPIAGFIGSIDDCNPDLEFMEQVADLLPEVSFVFIGRKQTDCSHLEARKNVWMLGQKPYQDVPQYGKCFDVAILPLRQSPWTEAVNPLKLKEYLALGKPIISTPFNELSKYLDVVYKAVTPAEFARKIEQALSENTPEIVTRRRKKVQGASWDSKAETILQELFHTESSIS
jgi:glycosyltransferase involved in cell wall biosynthesis